jgi:hypothetical protein
MVAKAGLDATRPETGGMITGWQNKLRAAIAHVVPGAAAALEGPWRRSAGRLVLVP